MARHWKKHKSHKMGGARKIAKGVGTLAADAFIVAPLAIPVLAFGKLVAAGQPMSTAMTNTIYTTTGVSATDGSIDFGKLTKFALASSAMVLIGVGMKRYLVKRL